MRKVLLIFLPIAILFLSCSTDDEAVRDSIIGFWDYSGISITLKDGSRNQVKSSECYEGLDMFFKANNKFSLSIPICEENIYNHVQIGGYDGSWHKISENHYWANLKFYYVTSYLPEPGEYYEEGEANFDFDVSFPDDKTMYVHNQDLLGYYPEEILDENVSSYSIIYKRPN